MEMNRFKLLILLTCHYTLALKKDFPSLQTSNALTRGVVEIIEQFYIGRTNTLNFYHASRESEDENLNQNLDLLNEILAQVQSRVVVQLEGYMDFKATNRKRVHNIILVDSYESFQSFFRLMSPYYFEYQGFYLFVLTTYSQEQYTIMKDMFEWLWAEYVINVNIIWLAPEYEEEAIMYTYFPYTSFYCGRAIPIQLNQFRFGEWLHSRSDFFPEKMKNLYGCPLTVATVDSPPFMILEERNGEIIAEGMDGVLIRVLSQRMNFKINFQWVAEQGNVNMKRESSGEHQLRVRLYSNEEPF